MANMLTKIGLSDADRLTILANVEQGRAQKLGNASSESEEAPNSRGWSSKPPETAPFNEISLPLVSWVVLHRLQDEPILYGILLPLTPFFVVGSIAMTILKYL